MSAKFLIAHPDAFTVRALEIALRDERHNVRVAQEGLDAVDRALDERPDAIILGLDLPGLGGLDVARTLRALEPTRHIPILFVVDRAAAAQIVTRAGLAFVDTLVGPIDLARMREVTAKLLRAGLPTPAVRALEPDKQLAAISDPLTGLYARHYALHRLAYEAARSARYKTNLACILFGVSDFTRLVEACGSLVGDRVLIAVANILRHGARVVDIIGRGRADEFMVIAPQTDPTGARQFAVRVEQMVAEHAFELPAPRLEVQICAGMATANGSSLADNLALLGRAEDALNRARAEHQERIVLG